MTLSREEKEKLVLDLYYNKGYTIRISGDGIHTARKWITNFQEFLKTQSNLDYRQIEAIGSEIGKLREIWRILNSNNHLQKTFLESQTG